MPGPCRPTATPDRFLRTPGASAQVQLDRDNGIFIPAIRVRGSRIGQRPARQQPGRAARRPAAHHDIRGNRHHHAMNADAGVDRGQHRRFASPRHTEHGQPRTRRRQLVFQDLQGSNEVFQADAAKLVRQPRSGEVGDRQRSDSLTRKSFAHIRRFAAARSPDQQNSRVAVNAGRNEQRSMHRVGRPPEPADAVNSHALNPAAPTPAHAANQACRTGQTRRDCRGSARTPLRRNGPAARTARATARRPRTLLRISASGNVHGRHQTDRAAQQPAAARNYLCGSAWPAP